MLRFMGRWERMVREIEWWLLMLRSISHYHYDYLGCCDDDGFGTSLSLERRANCRQTGVKGKT